MRILFLMAFLSIHLFSTNNVKVIQLLNSGKFFDDGATYNVVTFDYILPTNNVTYNIDILETDPTTIRVGIVSTDNVLNDLIWEYQGNFQQDTFSFIQSTDITDLNNDGKSDITISYYDNDSNLPDQVISSFLLNKNDKFIEISETFNINRYQFLENNHIRLESPLSMFGQPYFDEDTQQKTNYWIDYYEFQDFNLVNINQKYRQFYETFRMDSVNELNNILIKIKDYRMSDEITINQLQLEEYFNQITELKTIIHRSEKLLY